VLLKKDITRGIMPRTLVFVCAQIGIPEGALVVKRDLGERGLFFPGRRPGLGYRPPAGGLTRRD